MPPEVRTGPLPSGQVPAVLALAARAETADGVAPLGEESLLALSPAAGDPTPSGAVVHLVDGARAYGLVRLGLGPSPYLPDATSTAVAELVVDPGHRGQGAGSALLAAAEQVASEADDRLLVWAHGDLPAARRLAAAHGFAKVRDLWFLGRDVRPEDAETPVRLPDGVRVRPFEPGRDDEDWVGLNARAFADHPEQGRLDLADLRTRTSAAWFDPADLLLAERDGELVGSTWVKADPDRPHEVELYALGVDPVAQGSGLGAALTALTLLRALEHAAERLVLYVDASNQAAVRTYDRAGFTLLARDAQYAAPA